MSDKLTEQEVIDLLDAMDCGKVEFSLVGDRKWSDAYCGDMVFRTATGFEVVVFNDCDAWDYLDHVYAPDGREYDFEDAWPERGTPVMTRLLKWAPIFMTRWRDAPLVPK